MLRKLMQKLQAAMFTQLRVDPPAAADPAPAPVAPVVPPPNVDMSKVPAELQDDAAFLEDLAVLVGDKPVAEPGEEPSREPDPANTDIKPEDKPAEEEPEDEGELVFENDLDIGDVKFSKDILKTFDKGVVENLGKLKVALDENKAKVEEFEGYKANLLKDPVIADRIARKAAGTDTQPYVKVGVTKETKAAVVSALEAQGLSEEDANAVFETMRSEVSKDLEYFETHIRSNTLLETESKREVERIDAEGKATISNIAKMNKDLTEDAVREWCLDPARKGSAKNGGLTYADLVRLKESVGEEAVYTAIAKTKNLPVVINTKDRDKKMVLAERNKYIEATGAKRVAKAMKGASVGTAQNVKGGTIDNEGGILDKSKLGDYGYVEDLLSRAKDEKEIFEIQKQLIKQSGE
jgi:hypothetical protein